MNKIVSILVLSIISSSLSGQNALPIDTIRSNYLKAGEKPELRSDFLNYFKVNKPKSFLAQGYYAASVAMYAEVAQGRKNQMSFFKKGRALLDTVIKNNPNNAELRYLRFDIQEHVPGFLFYNNQTEDVEVMIQEIESLQKIGLDKLKNRIKEVLLNCDVLTEEQKEFVSRNL